MNNFINTNLFKNNHNLPAKFITFEGGEGSGKSTQSKLLYEYLIFTGKKAILTREIGGTPEAEKIRELILFNELSPISELFLVMAARFEHISKVILPALKNNVWVICDRFIDSTASYQGQSIDINDIYSLHEKYMLLPEINKALLPDLTFFINVPPHISLKRIVGRKDNNKFEDKELIFHENVYEMFVKLSKKFKDRIIDIECLNLNAETIHQNIRKFLLKL